MTNRANTTQKKRCSNILQCVLFLLILLFSTITPLFSQHPIANATSSHQPELDAEINADFINDHQLFLLPETWTINENIARNGQNITLFYGNPTTATALNSTQLHISSVQVLNPDGTIDNLSYQLATINQKNINISIYTIPFQPDENLTGAYHIYANVSYEINTNSSNLTNNAGTYHVHSYPKLILFYTGTNSWDQQTNQPVELLPLIRPDHLFAQSLFTGQIRKTMYHMHDDYFIRNTSIYMNQFGNGFSTELKPDPNGVFSFSFPYQGTYVLTTTTAINTTSIQHRNMTLKQSSLTLPVDQHPIITHLNQNNTKLSQNDKTLDQNIRFVYTKLQDTKFYLNVFILTSIILFTILFVLLYRLRKKELICCSYRKYNYIKKNVYRIYRKVKNSYFYRVYSKLKSFVLKLLKIIYFIIVKNSFSRLLNKYLLNFLHWSKKHEMKSLLFIYFLLLAFITLLGFLFSKPVAIADDFVYTKMARSFFYNGNFSIAGNPTHKYPPLYPMLLSPAYFFKDMNVVYYGLIFLNSMMYSTMIFPLYFFSKNFLDKKQSFIVSFLITLVPVYFLRNMILLSENLLFPLFLFTVLFLYESIFEKGYKFKILTGFFLGLCFLTKFIVVAIVPAFLIILIGLGIYNRKKHSILFSSLKATFNWFIISFVTGITFLPWMMRNGSIFGYTFLGMIGYEGYNKYTMRILSDVSSSTIQPSQISVGNGVSTVMSLSSVRTLFDMIETFFLNTMMYHGILIISSGIILSALLLILLLRSYKEKQKKLFSLVFITIICTEALIFLASFHHARGFEVTISQHRYVEPLLPLILLGGIIAFKEIKKRSFKLFLSLFICIIPLYFVLTSIGFEKGILFFQNLIPGLNFLIDFTWFFAILMLILLFFVFLILYNQNNEVKKKLVILLAFLIIFSSGFVMSSKNVVIKNSIYKSELSSVGHKLDDVGSFDDIVIFDKTIGKYSGAKKTILSLVNKDFINLNSNFENFSNSKIRYLVSFNDSYDFDIILRKNVTSPYSDISYADQYGLSSKFWKDEIYVYLVRSG